MSVEWTSVKDADLFAANPLGIRLIHGGARTTGVVPMIREDYSVAPRAVAAQTRQRRVSTIQVPTPR